VASRGVSSPKKFTEPDERLLLAIRNAADPPTYLEIENPATDAPALSSTPAKRSDEDQPGDIVEEIFRLIDMGTGRLKKTGLIKGVRTHLYVRLALQVHNQEMDKECGQRVLQLFGEIDADASNCINVQEFSECLQAIWDDNPGNTLKLHEEAKSNEDTTSAPKP